MTPPAFYARDGDRFVPTGLGTSPWNPAAQMGVALAGLVAHALDGVGDPAPMATARLTLDLLGAVPIAPLVPHVRVLREGRQFRIVEVELRIGDRAWVRADALRVRIAETPGRHAPLTRPPPDRARALARLPWVETIRLEGDFRHPGPGASWLRLTGEVVAGVPLSTLAAAAMAADFGSGTAPLASPEEWTFANVDISLHLTRLPRGEWLLLDAESSGAGDGFGLAHARLGDADGMIGAVHQTVFLARRAGSRP